MSLLALGHWTDLEALTGCTVLLPPAGAVCAAEVRGGGPGTRETALLGPGTVHARADAILLTGGSAFGLTAAAGVQDGLAARGVGLPTPGGPVPIVPAAVVFDIVLGASTAPDAAAGAAALEQALAGAGPARGNVGVGTGCTVGKLDGAAGWMRGGLGTSASTLWDGTTVQAWAAVNAFGDVIGEDGAPLAGLRREGVLVRTDAAVLAGSGAGAVRRGDHARGRRDGRHARQAPRAPPGRCRAHRDRPRDGAGGDQRRRRHGLRRRHGGPPGAAAPGPGGGGRSGRRGGGSRRGPGRRKHRGLSRVGTHVNSDSSGVDPMVTVYSTNWCGACVGAKALLTKRGIPFREINLDDDPSFRQKLMDLTGRFTVPQIFVGEQHIGGFDDLRKLDQNGRLAELVEAA